MTLPPSLTNKARKIRWLLLDVDGVLTDGRLYYGPRGGKSAGGEPGAGVLKAFDTSDGLGIKLAQWAGLKVGLLTGRADEGVLIRARELGLDEVVSGRQEKAPAFGEFLERHGIDAQAVAYAGDDLPDLPVLLTCGLSFTPVNASPDVRERVDVVLTRKGGRGAVREMVELLLKARGQWDATVERFLPSDPTQTDAIS